MVLVSIGRSSVAPPWPKLSRPSNTSPGGEGGAALRKQRGRIESDDASSARGDAFANGLAGAALDGRTPFQAHPRGCNPSPSHSLRSGPLPLPSGRGVGASTVQFGVVAEDAVFVEGDATRRREVG